MKPVFPIGLVAAIALILGSTTFPVARFLLNFSRPQIDLDRLSVGMSKAQVEQILGHPKSRDEVGWGYSRMPSGAIEYVPFVERDGFIEAVNAD